MNRQLVTGGCLLVLFAAACTPGTEDNEKKDAAVNDIDLSSDAPKLDTAYDAGSTGNDRAVPDTASADLSSAPDTNTAGDDAGACSSAFTLCDGISASGNNYTLLTSGAGISGSHSVSIGDTMASVDGEMAGLTKTISPNAVFTVIYCSEGLTFYFADDLNDTPANEGVLTDNDTLYKIVAWGDFAGSTNTSPPLAIGDNGSTAQQALGAGDYTGSAVSSNGSLGEFRFYYSGHSVLLVDDAVATISVFPQQQAGTINASIDLAAGTVGSILADHEVVMVPAPRGSTLTQIRSAFGATPEADGDTAVDVDGSAVDLLILSYSVLGLRFSGLASQYSGGVPLTGDARKIFTTAVNAPFQGTDNGLGMGSTRADFETRFGAPYGNDSANGVVLYKYNTGTRKTGVIYMEDSACTERIAFLFVNLID